MQYIISTKSTEDLEQIWRYTYLRWSEQQADRYYILIIKKIDLIAQHPTVGRVIWAAKFAPDTPIAGAEYLSDGSTSFCKKTHFYPFLSNFRKYSQIVAFYSQIVALFKKNDYIFAAWIELERITK